MKKERSDRASEELNRILKKKKWTGKDVGTMLLINLIHTIKKTSKNHTISRETYNKMMDSLDTEYKYTQYKILESMYKGLWDSIRVVEAMGQQCYQGHYRYYLSVSEIVRAEIAISEIAKLCNSDKSNCDITIAKLKNKLFGIDYLKSHKGEAEYIADNLYILALPALSYMYAHNTYIEMLAKVYNIDFLLDLKHDVGNWEGLLEENNKLIHELIAKVYGADTTEKNKKIAFIKEKFPIINFDSLKPTAEAVRSLKDKLQGLKRTTNDKVELAHPQNFIDMVRRME